MTAGAAGVRLMWGEGLERLLGRLVVVSGPSGTGKSSMVRRALDDPSVNARLSVSATTRAPRPGETDGKDYRFTDQASFKAAREAGEFLEWAEYNGQCYGTPSKPVFEELAGGRSVVLEIEVVGAKQVRATAPTALFVFVRTPRFRDLEDRLRARGTETDAEVIRRLRKGREELAEAHWYDVQLINDDFDRCVADFRAILNDSH